jgi:hypothetical protein
MPHTFKKVGKQGEIFPIRPSQLPPKKQESECVASLEYFIDDQQLVIHFMKRGSYTYYDVPPHEYLNLNNASSRGKYFNLYIRDRYEYERIA